MQTHASEGDVLDAACMALGNLTEGTCATENCFRAHRAGALVALLDVMRANQKRRIVQNYGSMALGYICFAVKSAPARAVQLGAPAIIINNALRTFPKLKQMQVTACFALSAMLPVEDAEREEQPDVDAVHCIIHALRVYAADSDVQYHACLVLSRLTKYQPVKAEAWRLGVFALLVKVLQAQISQPAVLERCLCAAADLLLNIRLAGSACLHATPEDAGAAIYAALDALRAHPANVAVHSVACAFISELLLHAPEVSIAAAEAGALELMVHALQTFPSAVISPFVCKVLGHLAIHASAHRHRAHAAGGIAALVTAMATDSVELQVAAAFALFVLCADDLDACAHAVQCGAVKPLCDCAARCMQIGEPDTLAIALKALAFLVNNNASAAAEAAAAGHACISVAVHLLRESALHDYSNVQSACVLLARVTACDAAAVSSADAVLPLLHMLEACSLEYKYPKTTKTVCEALQMVMQSSAAHAAEAAKRGAAAAVDAAARAHSADAELQRIAAEIRALLARMEAQSPAAVAKAREEAERRAAAMADALIAEEEAERAARAAPPVAPVRKRHKKKRGGGGGDEADAEEAAVAADDAAPAPELEGISAEPATVVLSALALDATPSAAAVRRRRRAATKAARPLAQSAGAAGASGPAGAGAAETEDDADEGDAADAAAEAAQPAAPPSSPPPPLPPPPLPPPPPPRMKECCVCLLDMPAAEQVVLGPCGHRCMCEECWHTQLLPRAPAARLCPICDAPVAMAMRLFDA